MASQLSNAQKQMGPALLPTPLSPARGLPSVPHPKMLPFRERLAPGVFPRARRPAFCHRRSRRHPVLPTNPSASFGRGLIPQLSLPSVSPRPFHPLLVVPSGSVRPKPFFPFVSDQVSRSWWRTNVAWSSSSLASGRNLLQSTLAGRVDSRFHIGLFRKSQVFQSFRMRNSKSSSRLDDLRLRLESDSGKRWPGDFSTFKRFSCGGRWITQPLVDSFRLFRVSAARIPNVASQHPASGGLRLTCHACRAA